MAWKYDVAIAGMALDPSGVHHRKIVEALLEMVGKVVVVPCGIRPDKPSLKDTLSVHRGAMARMTFADLGERVIVDDFDLDSPVFTPTHELLRRYRHLGRLSIVVGTDLLDDTNERICTVRRCWQHGEELWNSEHFAVVVREGIPLRRDFLPPRHVLVYPGISGEASSTEIRRRCAEYEPYEHMVVPRVAEYIERHHLYRGTEAMSDMRLRIKDPRLLVVADARNPRAMALKEKFAPFADDKNPNLIVVVGGDGTMLHAAQNLWNRWLLFVGLNAGHRGFLLNDIPDDISRTFFEQEFEVVFGNFLHVDAAAPDGSTQAALAFNDAWVQVELGNTGWFELSVNRNILIPFIDGDAVLVASPMGSTAYARNMGMVPLPLGSNNLVIAGSNINASLGWKGENVLNDSVVAIRTKDDTRYRKLYGFADNIKFGEVTEMTVRRSRRAAAEMLFLPGYEQRRREKLRRS